MFSVLNQYEQPVATTIKLLDRLRVRVTKNSVNQELQQHPDYPSLFSISDTLKKWKVDNIALEVAAEKLEEIPTPFIAHTRVRGGNFLLITAVNGTVKYLNEKGIETEKRKEDFLKEWTNTVLLAEATQQSGEKNYKDSRRQELAGNLRIPLMMAAGVLLILLHIFQKPYDTAWMLSSAGLVIKLAGIVVTGLLLWFEIDRSNPVLKQICTTGKKTNCTAVLDSKHAKLLNMISWSELGFFYFTATFLLLLINDHATGITSILSIVVLPYTVFSIIYQWRVIQQWCPLCLTIQALLVADAAIGYFHGVDVTLFTQRPDDSLISSMVISVVLPILFWFFAKPILLQAQQGRDHKKELTKLKYNPAIFGSLLPKQKRINSLPADMGITLGNPNAAHTITKVCNPYCGPCAKAHTTIDDLMRTNEDIKLQIIFAVPDNERDARAKPVRHFMALYDKKDPLLMHRALHDWYTANKKDYDSFAQQYKLGDELANQGAKLKAMEQWSIDMEIDATPTIFIDGYQLPDIYKAEDLKYLLQ